MNTAESFALFSLPNELIHHLIQFFTPESWLSLAQCNHELNELSNSGYLWRSYINIYKSKIISVDSDVSGKKLFSLSQNRNQSDKSI